VEEYNNLFAYNTQHPLGGPTPWIWPKVCACTPCSAQKPTPNSWLSYNSYSFATL